MKNEKFSNILKALAKQTPEEKLRIAFNLWQFVNELSIQNKRYGKRNTNTARTSA